MPAKPGPTDVLIFGTGPAGAAAAIFLLQAGFTVALIERPVRGSGSLGPVVGESLSPAAGSLLRQLGVWETFLAGPHLSWTGNISYWGSSLPAYTDLIRHPCGPGWHIDRDGFNRLLLARALGLGALVYRMDGVFELQETVNGWTVSYEDVSFGSSFLVDASGAAHVLGRRLRVTRCKMHDQLALTAFLQTDDTSGDGQSLIESVADGWWYTAAIPGNRRVVCYFTSGHNRLVREGMTAERWWELLGHTQVIGERVFAAGGSLLVPPRFADASSSFSEKLYGNRWVAVGDAACRYDPLTAHGLMMALTSARDAACAIGEGREGLQDYAYRMKELFLHAESECRLLYRQGQTFPCRKIIGPGAAAVIGSPGPAG